MSEDILELADETRSSTINGTSVMFRAYIATDQTERLIWRVGDTTGKRALLDKTEGVVTLPQGKEVEYKGRMTHYINIPRWLTDALMNDFTQLEDSGFNPISDSPPSLQESASETIEGQEADNEEIKPMFNDIDIEDNTESS